MRATMATKARLKITRAGICHRENVTDQLVEGRGFAEASWGFRDGSVLIYRRNLFGRLRGDDGSLTPTQLSRRLWAAFDPH